MRIEEVVNCGGIAEKNPLVMQIYAECQSADESQPLRPNVCAWVPLFLGLWPPALIKPSNAQAKNDRRQTDSLQTKA